MKRTDTVVNLFALVLTGCAIPAMAADDKIPTTNGFSGNVIFGAGYLDLESNFVAGNKLIDVRNSTVSSVNASPQSRDDGYPFVTGEVAYTFGDRWQAFLGSSIEDLVTLDFSQRLGVRKDWDKVGVMGVALLFSGIPAEVWKDPYLAGTSRSDTDRDSSGVRFDWWRVLETNFFFQAQTREIDVSDEESGTDPALGLTPAEISSLRRDGDDSLITLGYRWENGQSTWQPEVSFGKQDRDGNAVSNDVKLGKLTYSYQGDEWTVVASGLFSQQDYDQANPVYNKRTDETSYAMAFTAFRKLSLFGSGWRAFGSASYGDLDSDVNFFDSTGLGINLGLQYSFGAK